MSDTVKRVNYYDHQFLHVEDFTDEQKYHLDMRRLHNQRLHTWGIVQGLQVTVASGGTGTAVSVSAGVAIDSQGQEMVQPDKTLELGAEAAGTTLYITIAYAEQQSDPKEAGVSGNTRIIESPTLSFTKDAPADKSMTLILAKVPRTSTGLGTVDGSDRKQAGVVLGNDLTINTVTLKKDGVAQNNWPVLSCSAANQAALANAGLVVNGNVGIGTTSPTRLLEVNQGTPTAFSISDRLFLDGSGAGTVRITNNAYVNSSGSWAIATAANKASTIEIRNTGVVDIYGTLTAGAADWQQMASFDAGNNHVLFPNGNVGIGTPSPQSTLDVAGTAHFMINYNGKFPSYGSTMGAGGLAIGWNGQGDTHGETDFVNFPGAGAGGFNFVLADNKGNVSSTPMIVTGGGNVGIGAAPIKAKLEVDGMVGNTVGLFGGGQQGMSLVASWPNLGFNCYYNGGWKAISAGWSGNIDVSQNDGSMSFYVNSTKADAADTALNPVNRFSIHSDGKLASPMWRATEVFNQRQGPLPMSSGLVSGGGTLVIIFSGSGFATAAGTIGISLEINETIVGTTHCFTNEANSHKAFTTGIIVLPGLAAGAHSLKLVLVPNTITDQNDYFTVTVLELPF